MNGSDEALEWYFSKRISLLNNEFFKENSTGVVDEESAKALELRNLVNIVEHSITETGKMLVDHRLHNPLTSPEEIIERQDALRELNANDNLRRSIEDFLARVEEAEEKAVLFLNGVSATQRYDQAVARELLKQLPKWVKSVPEPESFYLKSLIGGIKALENSPVQKLAKGPVFRKLFKREVCGLGELREKPVLVSPFPLHKFSFKPLYAASYAGAALGLFYLLAKSEGKDIFPPSDSSLLQAMLSYLGASLNASVGNVVGKLSDEKLLLEPLRKRLSSEKEAVNAYAAIGVLDELLSYHYFGKELPHATLPRIVKRERHSFSATNLVNAVQSQKILEYVPNDINLDNQPLTFLTGPNSGGKTSLGKSIAQAQILAQAGCYVPADSAEVGVADKVFYQVGRADTLKDEEGGFGTQLERIKEVFLESSPHSLIVLDDLIEGTTFEEKTRHTFTQLLGFHHKKPTLLYISHHHELAQKFKDLGIGNYLMVTFKDGKPTYKVEEGISTNSHSDRVVKKVGFDEEFILSYLRSHGYLKPEQALTDV